ncbi:MAG: hypothetical protein Fur0037_09750 [Planctomycetota bacterium]
MLEPTSPTRGPQHVELPVDHPIEAGDQAGQGLILGFEEAQRLEDSLKRRDVVGARFGPDAVAAFGPRLDSDVRER